MAEENALHVEVVAATRKVWEGEAVNVIVRTTEGDVGILPGHEPMLAALVPTVAQIVAADGRREVAALDGGFVSVAQNRVSLLAQYATMSDEISVSDAQHQIDRLSRIIDAGDASDDDIHQFHLAEAQLKAAAHASQGSQGIG